MIHVLTEGDHQQRSQSLAHAYGAQVTLASANPIGKPGLDTLTMWGHGDEYRLCGLSPEQMNNKIRAWKTLNSSLNTVEIITCNARFSPSGNDSYAVNLRNLLKAGFRNKTRNIVLKSLPVCSGGMTHVYSILLWDQVTLTWCYVTGPRKEDVAPGEFDHDGIMMDGQAKVKAAAGGFDADAPQVGCIVGAQIVERQDPKRKYSLTYGKLEQLRKILQPIR